jgi:hypothetical protein
VLALFGVVADRIEQDSGTDGLSIVGVFQQVSAPAFPHVVANVGVAARFEISPEECGSAITANVALVDEIGHRDHLDQRQRLLPGVRVDRPTFWDFALNLSRLTFEGPGRFHIVLRVDKQIVAEIPIWVVGQVAPYVPG